MTGLIGLAIIAVYWIFTNISWASKQGPSEMWTNAMHVQSENHAREYLIENGFSEEIQVDIDQDDVTYMIDSAAWNELSGLEDVFSVDPLPYLNEGKKAYWYQYTAPFVVTLNGEKIGTGTIYPIVIWNPKKGLTYQEIQSAGYREFVRFDLSPELAVQMTKPVSSSPEYGQWCYDPADMLTAEVEARLTAYNTQWNERYGSVTAVAAIEDFVEPDSIADFALQFRTDWGLDAGDMLLLIYNNGNACYWMYSPIMEITFGPDVLSNILDTGFEADPGDDSGDSALLNFFAALDDCYSTAYENTDYTMPTGSVLSELPISGPLNLSFSSGAGAWGTSLLLNRDGSFEGGYMDSDMGDQGNGYPYGTTYMCAFNGYFDSITQINDYSYSLTLKEVNMANEREGEWIEDGFRYITTEPIGMEQGKSFILYTPDAPIGKLSSEFLEWWPWGYTQEGDLMDTLSCYGLYNEEMGYGFFSYD